MHKLQEWTSFKIQKLKAGNYLYRVNAHVLLTQHISYKKRQQMCFIKGVNPKQKAIETIKAFPAEPGVHLLPFLPSCTTETFMAALCNTYTTALW